MYSRDTEQQEAGYEAPLNKVLRGNGRQEVRNKGRKNGEILSIYSRLPFTVLR